MPSTLAVEDEPVIPLSWWSSTLEPRERLRLRKFLIIKIIFRFLFYPLASPGDFCFGDECDRDRERETDCDDFDLCRARLRSLGDILRRR